MQIIKNIEIRAYIRIRNLLGILVSDIQKKLKSCFSDIAPQMNGVRKCVNRFKQGSESLERPKKAF